MIEENGVSDAGRPSDATDARGPRVDTITVKIGTRGDNHNLNLTEHVWERLPARLVLNAPYQSWADDGSFVHVVAFTPAMEPCANADFYLLDHHLGRADSHGTFAFRKSIGHDGSVLRVVCQSPQHKWYRGAIQYSSGARSQEFERPVVYLQADRGVYRPGQSIRIRALAWKLRGEYSPAADQTVNVWLQDSDASVMVGARVHTDVDGVGTLELPIESHMPEGSYRLVAEYVPPEQPSGNFGFGISSADSNSRTEAPIQIRRFEVPVIEIRHSLGEFLTPAMRSVPFTVNLGYVDGSRFQSARLEVTVITDGVRQSLPPIAVQSIGPQAITLPEAILQTARSQSEVRVEISATDANQRKDTVVRVMRVVENPYQASLELDRNGYAAGESVDVAARLVDLYSVVQRQKMVIGAGCGQQMRVRTDDSGMAHFRFTMPRGDCQFAVRTDDTVHSIASVTVPLSAVRPMQSRVLEEHIREQDPVTISVNFPANVLPVESVVHADVTDSSGAMIDSFLIPIEQTGGVPTAHTVIHPSTWGSMLVTLYTLGVPANDRRNVRKIGLLTDGQSLAVGAISHLEVTLHGTEGELRPGTQVPVSVEVTRDGQPVTAVLGVSVVDRGVINMLDPFEHPPFDRFYDPEQKVLASTGAQTLTWPVVQRTWGQDRYDIGWLPSFGMHHGAANSSDGEIDWSPLRVHTDPANPFSQLTNDGTLVGDTIGDAFGFGGLGATGTGWGGGGTGEGTIGLGNFGTVGHGSQEFADLRHGGESTQGTGGRRFISDPSEEPRNPVQLILRTGSDETSLWLPREHVTLPAGGAAGTGGTMQIVVPQTIGEHQINVLASDRRGGIALARATLTVRQPLSVRADVPENLAEGTEATVAVVAHNSANSAVEVDLSLRSSRWTVTPIGSSHATIAPQQSATARFHVMATGAGTLDYEAEARSSTLADVLRAHTWVRPTGTTHSEQRTAVVTSAQPWRTIITRAVPQCAGTLAQCTAHYQTATLSVSLPEATAWDGALDYVVPLFETDLLTAAASLDVAQSLAQSTQLASVRQQAELLFARAFSAIVSRTQPDSSSGPRRATPNLQTTAFIVDALARAQRQGYRLVEAPTAQWLTELERLPRRTDSERWIAVQAAMTLKRNSLIREWGTGRDQSFVQSSFDPNGALRAAHARLIQGVGDRPREFAEALGAWSIWSENMQAFPTLTTQLRLLLPAPLVVDSGVDPNRYEPSYGQLPRDSRDESLKQLGVTAARALLAWRQRLVNEPGAAVELDSVYCTAVAILTLQKLARTEVPGLLREASQFLRGRRARWSTWADPVASALALRVLGMAGIRPESSNASIVITVNGREVRRVQVDPQDPWASTLVLRGVELSGYLTDPNATLSVSYSGSLNAQVSLEIERFTR